MDRKWILALAVAWTFCAAVSAQAAALLAEPPASEDRVPSVPFQEGDVLSFDQVDMLKDYLPAAFWENRDYFFYESMALEIGPAFRNYGESDAYRSVTNENRGKASIGPDGSLANCVCRQRLSDTG